MMLSNVGRYPWPKWRQLLDSGHEMLVFPTGAIEQHGPHLPVNTDLVIAEAVCRHACENARVPMLPPLSFTVSVGHTAKWPGTFSLSHETFISTIVDLATWAEQTGWKKVLLVNSHFGNDASLRVAIDKVRTARMGHFQIGHCNTYALTNAIWDAFIADAEDLHANKAETDLMLHLAPDTVDMAAVEDDPDRTGDHVFSYPVAQTSLNGVTGKPSQGTAEAGKRLFLEMTEALTKMLVSAKAETPPLSP